MNDTADTSIITNALAPFKYRLFWIKLFLGTIFGASSYFILRFNRFITWYFLAPILYLVAILITIAYLYNKTKSGKNFDMKIYSRFSLHYTGTWIIAYFVLATAMFYFGW